MSTRNGWTLLVFGSSALAVIAAAASSGDGWSFLPLLWFLAVIPGLPYVRLVGTGGGPLGLWVGAVALSVALGAVVAEILLYTGTYGGVRAVFVLAGVACFGEVLVRLRRPVETAEPHEHAGMPAGRTS
jgi:hypothetical protein